MSDFLTQIRSSRGLPPERLLRRLPVALDLERLQKETAEVVATHGLCRERPQICLTSQPDDVDPLFGSAGHLPGELRREFRFNDVFRGTIFEEFYERIPYQLGRVRLLLAPPRSVYPFHRDGSPRLHVAIQTNPEAFLLVEEELNRPWRFHVPADGHVWWVDTSRIHSAMNGHDSLDRIHLVAVVTGEVDERSGVGFRG